MNQAPTLAAPAHSPTVSPAPLASPHSRGGRVGLFRRLFRAAASLHLALALLSLFTLCLIAATLLESWYSAAIAQELVYHTWWFSLLLGLLALNVLCAALKKLPWKKHQTGFLITHTGLLLLLAGGLLTVLGGTAGQLVLIDTPDKDVQRGFGLAQQGDTIQLAGRHQLEVYRISRSAAHDPLTLELMQAIDSGQELPDNLRDRLKGRQWTFPFAPGPFTWHADEYVQSDLPGGLCWLARLANPSPGLRASLDARTTLTVQNFYPFTEAWPYTRATGRHGFPVLKLRLTNPNDPAGKPMERWVAGLPHFEPDAGPVSFELLRLLEPALLPEFLNPPAASVMGALGQLVLLVGPDQRPFRIPVEADRLGKAMELPGTGLQLTLLKCGDLVELVKETAAVAGPPRNPSVQLALSGPAGRGEYLVCSRLPDVPALRKGQAPDHVALWYHYPDFRAADKDLMGSLQFLQAPGGKVYYRVYGKDGLRQPGQKLDVSDAAAFHDLPWKPMTLRFQVAGYLADAEEGVTVVPRQVRPGAEPAELLRPAVRCTLTAGDRTEEFWVRMSRRAVRVLVGDDIFLVRYRTDARRLDFTLTLKRAQQVSDPGTDRPASFASDVVLTVPKDGGPETRDVRISMNQPLEHAGYKVYQASYRPLLDPDTFQPVNSSAGDRVSVSGLTVAHDPGLACKYGGSFLVVLGIATMFFMKAYFFKPRAHATRCAGSDTSLKR